jgi:hypothetical protein
MAKTLSQGIDRVNAKDRLERPAPEPDRSRFSALDPTRECSVRTNAEAPLLRGGVRPSSVEGRPTNSSPTGSAAAVTCVPPPAIRSTTVVVNPAGTWTLGRPDAELTILPPAARKPTVGSPGAPTRVAGTVFIGNTIASSW